MIDFIIPVRDRDNERIQNCINSINGKSVGRIIIIDYGSLKPVNVDADIITVNKNDYPVWNKAHALNIGIRSSKAKYIATIDCDIILPRGFVDKANKEIDLNKFVLSNKVRRIKEFTNYNESLEQSTDWIASNPNYEKAVGGIQIFPRDWACKYKGYDEELTYWGGMDTFMYKLAIVSGLEVVHLDQTILHQEHEFKKENNLQDSAERMKAKSERLNRRHRIDGMVKQAISFDNWGKINQNNICLTENQEFLDNNTEQNIKISCVIMSHKKRKRKAELLLAKLIVYPFIDCQIIWDKKNDTWDTGERAIRSGITSKGEYHVVIQDDAIIADNFYEHLTDAIKYCPTKTLISLYTGTGRPLAKRIKTAVDRAKYCSWLRGYMLYWGVGIVIPTEHIEAVLEYANGRDEQYDVRTGIFYLRNRLPIFYTNPSLVDHDDDMKSIMDHGHGEEPRKAHHFVDGPINWNKKFVDI